MNANVQALPPAYSRRASEQTQSLQKFESLLHDCCTLSNEDGFWQMVADGVRSIERTMDRDEAVRFEYGVDRILALHGFEAWSAVKPVL